LQCVAVCWSVLQSVAGCCSVLQCVAECCRVLQCVAVCCIVLQCVAGCCSVLQCEPDVWAFAVSFLCEAEKARLSPREAPLPARVPGLPERKEEVLE